MPLTPEAELAMEQLGIEIADEVERSLARWRDDRLLTRAEMMRHAFDERIVTLEAEAGEPLQELFAIEAYAVTNVFHQHRDHYAAEAATYLSDELVADIDALGVGNAVRDRVYAEVSKVRDGLIPQLRSAADQEIARRAA